MMVHNLAIADDDVRKGSKKVAIEVEGIDVHPGGRTDMPSDQARRNAT
jgi:hypothetical protein